MRVALGGDQVAGVFRDRLEGIVVDFRAGDDRDGVVEQVDQLAEHPGLGLAAQAQEQHVVLGEDRVLDLGDDRLFVAQDIGKQRLARLELGDQVAPHLILDRLASDIRSTSARPGSGADPSSSLACLSWISMRATMKATFMLGSGERKSTRAIDQICIAARQRVSDGERPSAQ